jgi:oxaloacetate decarboxylase beta subunit
VALIGFLMFGNLLRECGVLNSALRDGAEGAGQPHHAAAGHHGLRADDGGRVPDLRTLMILGLGLVAFVFDTIGGVLFAKVINLFLKHKINPMIGAAGISAFPMSARVIHKMGLQEDNQNFLLMHAAGANVAGQIASVIAGGIILNFFGTPSIWR